MPKGLPPATKDKNRAMILPPLFRSRKTQWFKNPISHHFPIGLLSLLISLALNLPGNAHEVSIQAEIQVQSPQGTLLNYSETTVPRNAQITSVTILVDYSTGKPMAKGRIEIYAPGRFEVPWQTGILNAQGKYTFRPDWSQRGTWTVKVSDRGHTHFIDLLL